MKKLSKEARLLIEQLQSVLDDQISDAQAFYDERTDAWREGERGENYSTWIDNLQTGRDALDDIETEPS